MIVLACGLSHVRSETLKAAAELKVSGQRFSILFLICLHKVLPVRKLLLYPLTMVIYDVIGDVIKVPYCGTNTVGSEQTPRKMRGV